jgi:hypothetical protein
MKCEKCQGDRILEISAKCNDTCTLEFKGVDTFGYVPNDLKLGGGDYIDLDLCLSCGHAQGMAYHPDPQFYTDHSEGDGDE